jgi:hypothetical protein
VAQQNDDGQMELVVNQKERTNMKPMVGVGILLIVIGALVLAYQGINYTREKKVLDVGSVHLTTETHERIPIPPILGGLALVGGVVLVVMGAGNKS